jgi:hypothetical protein
VLFCSPTRPGSCADITHAHQLGLLKLLADGPAVEILADAGYQGLGAQTGGRVVTPPRRKFKKNAPAWYEEMYERQRKAHSSRRIRVEHGIAHLKNWRALTRHLGRREHMSDTVQAVAGLLSHQQIADLTSARWRGIARAIPERPTSEGTVTTAATAGPVFDRKPPPTPFHGALRHSAQGFPRFRHKMGEDRHLLGSGDHTRLVSALGKIRLRTGPYLCSTTRTQWDCR